MLRVRAADKYAPRSLDYSPAPWTPGSRHERRRAIAGDSLEPAGSLFRSCDIEHCVPEILDHFVDGAFQHSLLIGMRAVQLGLTVIHDRTKPVCLHAFGAQLGIV